MPNLCTMVLAVSVLLVLIGPSALTISEQALRKQTVNVGLVYQNYARSKVYDKAFKEAIRSINTGQSITALRKFGTRYSLAHVDCVLPKGRFYPSDVLDCLCGTMIHNKVALIVFVTAGEDFDEATAAAQYFLHMASQTGIPIVAWNADNAGFTFADPLSAFRIVQMAPPIQHQIGAMIALLRRYNWSRFGVVAAKMAGSQQFLKHVLDAAHRQRADDRTFKPEVVHRAEIDVSLGSEHIEAQLTALKNSEARIILLYSSAMRAKKIFQVADGLGLLSSQYLWVGTQSVRGSMPTVVGATQPGMLTVNFHTVSNAMFPPADDVLPMIIGLAPKLFALGLWKLALTDDAIVASNSTCEPSDFSAVWPLGQHIYEKMLSSFLKGNPYHNRDGQHSFFYMFNAEGTLRDSYLTVSNLRTKRTKEPPSSGAQAGYYWDKVGEYTNGRLRMADIEWPEGRANPPPGTPDRFHVRVVTLNEPPFVIVSDLDPETRQCPGQQGAVCDWGGPNSTSLKCCTGYCVDLLNKLAGDIGFTYSLYKVHDEKWGLKSENGWNGLVRDLVDERADICVTSLKLNSERARDIDFSVPFLETGISMLVKIRSGVLSPTAFLEPFEYSTWIIILCVSIQAAALSIFAFEWISPYSFNMRPYPPPGHRFSLFRSYWLVWATLFSASVTTNVPRSSVSRVMSLIWAAFGLTFLAVYTANLAAFMITRIQFHDLTGINDPRIANAEDQSPMFRYGTVEGGNTHEVMKRNWLHMDAYVRRHGHFRVNVHAGIDAVRREELDAFIYDAVVLDYQAGKDANCELMTVGAWSSMTGYAFGFPKNSPHVKRVNQFMLQYQYKGACNRRDSSSQTTTSAPLGVENFLSAFVLLLGGILLSLLCLAGEFVYCRHLRRPLQRCGFSEWCGLVSMGLGKSLSFSDAVDRVRAWQARIHSLQSESSAPLGAGNYGADVRLFRLRWAPMPILPQARQISPRPSAPRIIVSEHIDNNNEDSINNNNVHTTVIQRNDNVNDDSNKSFDVNAEICANDNNNNDSNNSDSISNCQTTIDNKSDDNSSETAINLSAGIRQTLNITI